MVEDKPVYYITFLRHGESVGNLENRLQGLSDFPLSETGRAQARMLADRWKTEGVTFDTVISSPLSRASRRRKSSLPGWALPARKLTRSGWSATWVTVQG